MSQVILVKLILSLCSSFPIKSDIQMQCVEHYVNCSVYADGKIDIKRCQEFKKEEKNGNNQN